MLLTPATLIFIAAMLTALLLRQIFSRRLAHDVSMLIFRFFLRRAVPLIFACRHAADAASAAAFRFRYAFSLSAAAEATLFCCRHRRHTLSLRHADADDAPLPLLPFRCRYCAAFDYFSLFHAAITLISMPYFARCRSFSFFSPLR